MSTDRPYAFSHRSAIPVLTILFDMTAMRIVVAAIIKPRDHSADFDAISCVIASTSASPDIAPNP